MTLPQVTSQEVGSVTSANPSNARAEEPMPREVQHTVRCWVDLSEYRNGNYSPGRGLLIQAAWYLVSLVVFQSGCFPTSILKRWLLRLFGAQIGRRVVIKPHVRIKFPWRLRVGDHCWIGESVWIDNLADVTIGDHVCISQGAYLCTGSHDHRRRTFDLITRPIIIDSGAWIGAKSIVLPGCSVGCNSLIAAGSVVRQSLGANQIVAGNPAELISTRPAPET